MAKKTKEQKRKNRTKRLWRFLRLQIVLILLVIGAVTYYYAAGYAVKVKSMHEEAVSLVSKSTEDTFRRDETSIVYDVNGDVISELKGEKDVYYVEYEDTPTYMIEAFVAVEDQRFYSHHGVDYKGILRAVIAMLRNGEVTEGASTITQQLARNVFLTQDKTWERKVEEIYIATELEKKYTKSQIMEFYLNNIYFGNGYYGIGAASKGYFNTDVGHLSLSEMAFLAAIPNNPTYYDPLKNYDNTIARRDKILGDMLEDKVISEATYNQAIAKKIVITRPDEVEKKDYAETYTYYCATRALMELQGFTFQTVFDSEEEEKAYNKAYEEAYSTCNASLYTGGYRIYTALDLSMQEELQSAIDERLSAYDEVNEAGVYALQGAAVCIDNSTGLVKAIVGGRSQELDGYTLNRAYQSFRQPGSAIKPLLVYTPALERGYTADSVVNDTRIEGGPSNSDGRYLGRITLRRAVELSRNTIAYQLLEELTPEVGLSYLQNLNFSRLDEEDRQLAIALGGFTNGVSPLEMAAGYATLENDGAYRMPTCIARITDAAGAVIYEPETVETVVYDQNAARQMTDILEGVITSGTASGLGLSDMPSAGKTGTTNDNKDGWFVGYTRYYTTSVWVGYDMPREMTGLYGATYPGQIWQTFMETIHKNLPALDFLEPTSLSEEFLEQEEAEAAEESQATEDAQATEETPAGEETLNEEETSVAEETENSEN